MSVPQNSVVMSETRTERLQLLAKTETSSFLVGPQGGAGTGPNSFELLAASLSACTCTTVRIYADRKKLPLETVTVNVDFDGEQFNRTIMLTGNLDEAQRTELLEISEICPVTRILERSSRINTSLAS